MKKIFTALTALAVTASAFAQITGSLSPASGQLISGNAYHGGAIGITYSDAVGHFAEPDTIIAPVVTISVNDSTLVLDAYEVGSTGLYWGITFQDAVNDVLPSTDQYYPMTVSVSATADGQTVETLTGTYQYNPVCPLTSISPDNNSVVESKNQTVVFTFNQSVSYSSIRVVSGSLERTLDGGEGSSVSVSITEDDWAPVTGLQNSISVELVGVTVDGNSFSNIEGEEGMVVANYFIDETPTSVTYLGVDPAEDEATYQEVYDNYWYATFKFSDAVDLPESGSCAIVTFYDDSERDLAELELTSDDVFGDWNYRAGYYAIQVAVPEVPDDAEDYVSVQVRLNGITYQGTALTNQPSATYLRNLPSQNNAVRRVNQTANVSITDALQPSSVSVFDINGRPVKGNMKPSEIKFLPKGLYIIDNKKVII